MSEEAAWLGGSFLGILLCLWANLRELRRARLLADSPTSKALGVFVGMAELKGSAESPDPFTSFLAGRSCVHYRWTVEEHWSRTVTETVTDSKDNTTTRTRTESGWRTVAKGGESAPFYLQDETGIVRVCPDGAQLETETWFDETVGRGEPLYYAKGPAESVAHSDHRRRFRERGIPLHATLYVIGPARERGDIVAPEIAAARGAELFLISTRGEERVRAAMGRWAWFWGTLGFAVAWVPYFVAAVQARDSIVEPKISLIVLPMTFLAVGWIAGWVWMVHNSIVGLRQRVRQGWSLIDVQLRRRHDLIPLLVTALAGLSSHEQEVQVALARLRAQLQATAPGVAGADFAALAATLRAVAEKYPQLTAQEGFSRLQRELIETEQRVALARGYYNDIATEFATRLEAVPDRWVAALRGMRPEPLLLAGDFERAVVQVALR